jgi:hypothetical protein
MSAIAADRAQLAVVMASSTGEPLLADEPPPLAQPQPARWSRREEPGIGDFWRFISGF